MSFAHTVLALLVVFIWGTNFVVIKLGLMDFPPFLFATLRFTFSFFPWLFFVRHPSISWIVTAIIGILMGVGQFGLLFWAMQSAISPGMASLVVQAQVIFTIFMAMIFYSERPGSMQKIALSIAITGYVTVGWYSIGNSQESVSLFGLCIVLLVAFIWSCVNLLIRSVGCVSAFGLMVWSSAYSIPILLIISFIFEGSDLIFKSLNQASWIAWTSVFWQALGNTLFGFGIWNWLLARYPVSVVTPTALLVPVFGIISSVFFLNESLPIWKLIAIGLVLFGLVFNIYSATANNHNS